MIIKQLKSPNTKIIQIMLLLSAKLCNKSHKKMVRKYKRKCHTTTTDYEDVDKK